MSIEVRVLCEEESDIVDRLAVVGGRHHMTSISHNRRRFEVLLNEGKVECELPSVCSRTAADGVPTSTSN